MVGKNWVGLVKFASGQVDYNIGGGGGGQFSESFEWKLGFYSLERKLKRNRP